MLPDAWASTAFVETTSYEGQLVEAFVYGRRALRSWLEKGRAEARPVLDRLVVHGVSVIEGDVSVSLISASRLAMAAGPAPLDLAQQRQRRYSLSAVLDDVTDAEDRGIRAVVMSTAWKEAAELALLSAGCWIGTGKWLLRELRAQADPFGLAAWLDEGGDDDRALIEVCRAVLDSVGGYLQAGFLRGEPENLTADQFSEIRSDRP